jgi:hypothetical protein
MPCSGYGPGAAKCFGYRDGDNLWTSNRKHVGRFHGDAIYGSDERYLGERHNQNRLIVHRSKSAWRKCRFAP